MNFKKLSLLAIILLPLLVGLTIMLAEDSTGLFGLIFLAVLFLGYPIMLGIGAVTYVATKKNNNNYIYTLLGFGIPSVLLTLWETIGLG